MLSLSAFEIKVGGKREWGITNYELRMGTEIKGASPRTLVETRHGASLQLECVAQQFSVNPQPPIVL
ncbi:hypothetical protein [Planktothrix mougeotii]|uniref:Uncharacterized protein n=1 Tax=Planktothrix mougeotii LEGE 06226 TaxID=1828728 RepID=A0ABR9U6M1_9CYAN|nr:hypothetical protein [Planktothrix mougeotii]MBE9142085.1 hypothetical protein [Planktothrix mougeotii LEGE 06226]